MPLDTPSLIKDLLSLVEEESDKDVDPKEARERQAERLARAIHVFVNTGEVNTVVTGTSATGGAVTGTGKGKVT